MSGLLGGTEPRRPWTDPVKLPEGGTMHTVKRCCNGCGRQIGDVTDEEISAAINGRSLPDVRDECGCGHTCEHGPHEDELDHAPESAVDLGGL